MRNLITISDFTAHKILTQILPSSLPMETNIIPTNSEMKFADFQSDSTLKEKFYDSSTSDFCLKYSPPPKYSEIRKCTSLMSAVFSSTYHCKQLFSLMKNTKSRSRTCLTDGHLRGMHVKLGAAWNGQSQGGELTDRMIVV
jgi:hypothetical protein